MTDRPRFYYVKEVATELRRTEASVRWLIHTPPGVPPAPQLV